MTTDAKIKRVEEFVKDSIELHDTGHDWLHIERVRANAKFIASEERQGDLMLIDIASLLHDIGDRKFAGNGTDHVAEIRALLSVTGFDEHFINEVIIINQKISFSKGLNSEGTSIEFRIVQDADRLDAMGAIGIARAFNYGGFKNNLIYDPEGNRPSTIAHFYDKLLKLKDLMNTGTGKKLAGERHAFMEQFLEVFYHEYQLVK